MNRYMITFECEEAKGTFVVRWQYDVIEFEHICDAVVLFCEEKKITIDKSQIIILLFCKLNTGNQ